MSTNFKPYQYSSNKSFAENAYNAQQAQRVDSSPDRGWGCVVWAILLVLGVALYFAFGAAFVSVMGF